MGDTSSACPRCGDSSGLCSHDDVFFGAKALWEKPVPVRERKTDHWVVRDSDGVLHAAQVTRFIGPDSTVKELQVATACSPQVRQVRHVDPASPWYGSHLPTMRLEGSFTIVEWRVREAPTCLRCYALAVPRA